MIEIITKHMSANNLQMFIEDYQALMKAKANKEEWRKSMQSRRTIKEPLLKRIYERLYNRYDYYSYKRALNKTDLFYYMERDINLQLFYYCSTYIGLVIETALNDELMAAGVNTEQSFTLDMQYKTDILVNGIKYQIKNITYLNYKDQLQKYKDNNVMFIFYKVDYDNISFISCGGQYAFSANDVFTMSDKDYYNIIPAEQMIQRLAGREGGANG